MTIKQGSRGEEVKQVQAYLGLAVKFVNGNIIMV